MQQHIWSPLGIDEITFWPEQRPQLMANAADMSTRARDGSGKCVHGGLLPSTEGVEDCFGGHGAYATPRAFFKVLQSLLRDDEKLLKRETTQMMFQPQLSPQSRDMQNHVFATPALSKLFIGSFPESVAGGLDWGIGGALVRDTTRGWRRRGASCWSGMPNLFWVSLPPGFTSFHPFHVHINRSFPFPKFSRWRPLRLTTPS